MIAAAGSGRRLGAGGPKAFVEVAGRPLWEWSLGALRSASSIGRIVVAAPPGEESLVAGDGVEVVPGGETRAESVRAATAGLEDEFVVVHDAARPLITAALVDRVVARLAASAGVAGVIAAAPVADTLKRGGGDGSIAGTVSRDGLWAAQTPQAFRLATLRAAQSTAEATGDLTEATDEAALVERVGGRVLLELVDFPNPKVTTAADRALVEALLADRDLG